MSDDALDTFWVIVMALIMLTEATVIIPALIGVILGFVIIAIGAWAQGGE